MIKILFIVFFLQLTIPNYASYVFISSSPSDAKVSIIQKNGKLTTIGRTPLRMTNFSSSTKVVIDKANYYTQTNTISSSKSVQSFNYSLDPFSFDIQILDDTRQTLIRTNGQSLSHFDDRLTLPYGNYSVYSRDNALSIDYRSPYTPYIAFFSTVTILSTIFAVTGGVLANKYYGDFQGATSQEQLLSSLNKVAIWDTVTWSSVGIGTGALIGTIITASLDAKDKKRIKRFNGMNAPSQTSSYLTDFQEILILSSTGSDAALSKMNAFIRKYQGSDSHLMPDVYLRRAGVYLLQKKYNSAISDLKRVINVYPSRATYELSYKLLGDIYSATAQYDKAIESYEEVIKVIQTYEINDIQSSRLGALYELAKKNKKYREIFLNENTSRLSVSLKSRVQQQQAELRDE